MSEEITFDHCLLLKVGVIAEGDHCLSIMRILDAFKPSRIRLRLLALMPLNRSVSCNKFAGEIGVQICEDPLELMAVKHLDLVLEMTGNAHILADLARYKPASLGVLDYQASMLFLDIAHQYERVAERESEISLATSFASALLEASPDGVMVLDRNLRIINCNDSPIVTGGKGRESVLGKKCHEVIHEAMSPCATNNRLCPINQTLKTKRTARAAHEVVSQTGEVRVRQVTSYPLFNALGEIIQFVEVIRDITQDLSVRIERQAKVIKDDLARVAQEDRLASLGRLVASVCHEINNPISSIVTFNKLVLSYIREGNLPPQGLAGFDRYLDLSVKEALRCGDIVKNLLTFARPKNIETEQIDMADMVKTVMMLTAHQLEMAEVIADVQLPSDTAFVAWADSALIQQCLMNLIFNALESMPEGGRLTIRGQTQDDGQKIWLTVTDTGHGIDPDDIPQIFEPFYSTKKNGKGVGLGLSMVYGIIREHHGTVEVESEKDEGTVFKITLPARDTAVQ
ncbi:MAG: PAS domain-containing protein [Desulfobacteraceae bacterium]|nr:PAS domain-containing protein [Desulfobacteraceae bacterium]